MNTTAVTQATTYAPTSVAEVQRLVQAATLVMPHGAQTKAPLLHVDEAHAITRLDMRQLAGIIEYDPGEYTFTAYTGTRLADVAATLSAYGQYMPFDPPLVDAGATLGGTIAAGISGAGRYRYGGLRDFILGVDFVDGQGRLIRGGGKVVKNAAGFDIPKLMVGSMGRLGVLVSTSFKVFPAPPATATLRAELPTLTVALAAMARLMGGPYDLEALDLVPNADASVSLLARIGGPADVLIARLDRLRGLVGTGDAIMDDTALWTDAREFAWATGDSLLVKTAATPQTLPALDQAVHAANAPRRYAVGGNLAWFAWPNSPDSIDSCHALLSKLGISGLVLRGHAQRALIGAPLQMNFLNRVRAALDPTNRFLPFD